MISSIKNFDYQAAFNSTTKAAGTLLSSGIDWIAENGPKLKNTLVKVGEVAKHHFNSLAKLAGNGFSKLKEISQVAFQNISTFVDDLRKAPAAKEAGSFIAKNKGVIAAGLVVAVALYALYRWIKRTPAAKPLDMEKVNAQVANPNILSPVKPFVKAEPMLVKPALPKIVIEEVKHKHFTFCVNIITRISAEAAVKEASLRILDDAQGYVKKGELITMDFIHRDNIFPIAITKDSDVNKLYEAVNNFPLNREKIAVNAFQDAADVIEANAKINKNATQILFFITDETSDTTEQELSPINGKLAENKVHTFVIGVGKKHNKDALEKLAKSNGLEGSYIDEEDDTNLAQRIYVIFTNCLIKL